MSLSFPIRALTSAASLALVAGVAGSSLAAADDIIIDARQTIGYFDTNRIITDSRVTESSGLARSTYDRSILFTHNDSGDQPRIFAVDKGGLTKSVLNVPDAGFRDWEDLAPGPDHTLWAGDIGDNHLRRDVISVYKVTEPESLEAPTQALSSTKYDFAYPDKRRNAEALLVHPQTGRLMIVTKAKYGAGIYLAPEQLSTTGINRLTKVASTPYEAIITGGAYFRDGGRFVLRTGGTAYIYDSPTSTPRAVRLPKTFQGESIAATRGGQYLLAGTEGSNSPVYRVYVGLD